MPLLPPVHPGEVLRRLYSVATRAGLTSSKSGTRRSSRNFTASNPLNCTAWKRSEHRKQERITPRTQGTCARIYPWTLPQATQFDDNRSLNKCFISIQRNRKDTSGLNFSQSLENVHEHEQAGTLGFSNYTPNGKFEVILCEVSDTRCKSQDDFDKLIKPYRTN
jgi:hypothetical protein